MQTSARPNKPPGPKGLDRIRTIRGYRKYGPIVLSESFGFRFYIIARASSTTVS